ncbi:hypothetical protein PHYBLDRAFT_62277 [Phycomyces blakesleeanus NRRL 1555(-)]|uniref:Uncharacterized protein n=1 Tax=Phycomyces blakesleeanus (strain ATCC 8743b / DSM 1359 / FGSC 10004 / NBRC 33097 / NRRL 1555) TaxID=763407 RepID=A0A167Q2L9_PHYB8|nr:hypothetical protein PHYBLDRAFT_62277 [Phycomyces blakesleeanus NRRL 1555(-)]OAD78954.1 hypothetical protein PHYBLDRAFT_62277 [Phycomyces blakesleeanus NRRL 1555(-)]|eukprot:XP_018296994.1 hypothetical protein PHYBLDRAFT_62277 [Phycomyces blakesleeanus NRRL 1555(-)]
MRFVLLYCRLTAFDPSGVKDTARATSLQIRNINRKPEYLDIHTCISFTGLGKNEKYQELDTFAQFYDSAEDVIIDSKMMATKSDRGVWRVKAASSTKDSLYQRKRLE